MRCRSPESNITASDFFFAGIGKPAVSSCRKSLNSMGSAPVDKRGKRRRSGSGNDLLRDFYQIDEEDKKKKKKKKDNSEEACGDESEKEMYDLKSESKSEEESETEKNVASFDEESNEEAESKEVSEEEKEEDDTNEDDEAIYHDDGPEIPEENIPIIPKATHRLAIVNMDWKYVSANGLYVVLNSFLPKDETFFPNDSDWRWNKGSEIHHSFSMTLVGGGTNTGNLDDMKGGSQWD